MNAGVTIIGTGMTQFGKQVGRGVRDLALAASTEALDDSGLNAEAIDRIFFGNAAAGAIDQQQMIRGQVAFRGHPLGKRPLVNFENACASGGSAFEIAYDIIAGGRADCILAIGAEQLNHAERWRPFHALRGSTDISEIGEIEPGTDSSNSILMEYYAGVARGYLENSNAETIDFARVAVKNRDHALYNPLAHLRKPQTIDDVLNARMIVDPLTLPMCSPTTDGAAAIILCSAEFAEKRGLAGVQIASSQIASGASGSPVADASAKAYEESGLGPDDFDVIELHDAAAPAELFQYEEIGLCGSGEAVQLIRDGDTCLGGRIPVNTSGGLLSRGHPLGATGCAQIVEIAEQLRGRANGRQVEGARTGLAINGGGWLDGGYATTVATVMTIAH